MREDPNVILLGEDIAGGADVDHLLDDEAWGGALGVTKGIVQEFGREPRARHADHRGRRSSARPSARRRPGCARSPS